MHHFIRLGGQLLEVYPLTKPHRERTDVLVYVVRYRQTIIVTHHDILNDY